MYLAMPGLADDRSEWSRPDWNMIGASEAM